MKQDLIARCAFKPARPLALLFLTALLSACAVPGPVAEDGPEAGMRAAFKRDRDLCRANAERRIPYVDPKDSKAVGDRSYRVEGETQACMLSRGWNNPEHDGWRAGRSQG